MESNILKKLGLSEKEISVYLTLLENGAMSVRKTAELSGLNRGTTYDILKTMQKMGIVSYYHLDTKQHFVAENPDKLLKVFNEREAELKEVKSKIEQIIPELKSLQIKGGNKPVAKFYEGKQGIKFILDDILCSFDKSRDKEYYVYSAANVRDDVYIAYPDFNKKRIKGGIKVKTISFSPGGGTYGLDERKWIAANGESPTYILIYAGKCAFIARDIDDKPVGIIIQNKMIYETQKLIFLHLWKILQ